MNGRPKTKYLSITSGIRTSILSPLDLSSKEKTLSACINDKLQSNKIVV